LKAKVTGKHDGKAEKITVGQFINSISTDICDIVMRAGRLPLSQSSMKYACQVPCGPPDIANELYYGINALGY
jgi:hypothetical protein